MAKFRTEMKETRLLPSRSKAWKNNSAKFHSNPALILDCLNEYDAFDTFMDLDLHPSQFIAWDMENDCPLEKPSQYNYWLKHRFVSDVDDKIYTEYQEAEKRVIFEGFVFLKIDKLNKNNFWLSEIDYPNSVTYFRGGQTISDLEGKVYLKEWKYNELKLNK